MRNQIHTLDSAIGGWVDEDFYVYAGSTAWAKRISATKYSDF
jgi:hypothetical protein